MSGLLAIAVLAAGSAERFGGGKLDAPVAGKPLGRWALDTAMQIDSALVAVVGSNPKPAFAQGAEFMFNAYARKGIGTSVSAAARWAMQARADALVILLADMPLVSLATLENLVKDELPAAVFYSDGRAGVPACFPAAMLPDLAVMTGEQGAAALLRERNDVRLVATGTQELRDVDRPEDLAEVAAILSGR
jgi:molybdenum cofactor cytidylyltransferase